MNSRIVICLSLLAILGLAPGCEKQEPNWCPTHPDVPECVDGGPSGSNGSNGPQCDVDKPCANPMVCDLDGAKTCVQCTPMQAAACTGMTPACIDNACHGCTAHNQCASAACLPDGSCGDDTNVAYADEGGKAGASCTKGAPCIKIADAVAAGKPFIKLHGRFTEQVLINSRSVAFLADPGTTLTYDKAGVILNVDGTNVAVYDLEITGGLGQGGTGISFQGNGNAATTLGLYRTKITSNGGSGILATDGTLIISQSMISANARGGVSVSNSQFDISNTMIVVNGGPSSDYGGLLVAAMNSGMRNFQFNTVAQNVSKIGTPSGVLCTTLDPSIVLSNNIIYNNGSGMQVEDSSCKWMYSNIGPVMVSGVTNIKEDPMFVDPSHGDFHLSTGSPAKDNADPAASISVDFEGDPRPQPEGGRRDIGADEFK